MIGRKSQCQPACTVTAPARNGPLPSPRTTEAAQSEIDRFRAAASGAAPAISASVADMTAAAYLFRLA
jgi:hypothetical protein